MAIAVNLAFIAIVLLIVAIFMDKISIMVKKLSISNIRSSYNKGWVAKVISHFVPKASSNKQRWFKQVTEEAFINLKIEQLYFYKLSLALVIMILIILIEITNVQVEKAQIINETNNFVESIVGSEIAEIIRLDKVMREVNLGVILNSARVQAVEHIKETLIIMTGISALPENVSMIIYEGILNVNRSFSLNKLFFPIIGLIIGYWIPDLGLLIYAKARHRKFDTEVQNLEMLTLIIGGVPNITAKDIIEELLLNSRVFKSILHEFYKDYLIDRHMAYKSIMEKPINKDFEKVMHTIRQIETSDRTAALQALELSRESRRQSRRLSSEEWVKKKDFIALLLYIVVVIMLMRVVVMPWVKELNVFNQITNMF